ncbi:MAG: TolC family protein [Helicobacteraceae bacterium]|nr:TolC family protein [Helicobacteraceae bacterium]
MKTILLLCLFFSFDLLAQSLWEILQSTPQNNKLKALQYRQDAQSAQTQAQLSYEAPTISLDVGSAQEKAGEDGVEYALAFSQEIQTPFALEEKNSAQRAMIRSLALSTEYENNSFVLDLALSYHLACVDKESFELLHLLVTEQKKAFDRLRVAYELGEISRKDLLFHQVEYLKLQEQERYFQRLYERSLLALQSQVQNLEIDTLTCSDMILPSEENLKIEPQKHAKLQALAYERDAATSYFKLSDSFVQSLGYSLSYEKELDKKRYGVMVSIPLTSFTSKQEQLQAQYLHTQSALEEELNSLSYELDQNAKSLRARLHSNYESYTTYQEQVIPLSKELQELSLIALFEGEGSVLESLDATRSYLSNTLGMLEKKRTYYQELFALYKITDRRLGEINE